MLVLEHYLTLCARIGKNKLGPEGKSALAEAIPTSKYGLRAADTIAKAQAKETRRLQREAEKAAALAAKQHAEMQKQEQQTKKRVDAIAAAENAAQKAATARKHRLKKDLQAEAKAVGAAKVVARTDEFAKSVALARKIERVEKAMAVLDNVIAVASPKFAAEHSIATQPTGAPIEGDVAAQLEVLAAAVGDTKIKKPNKGDHPVIRTARKRLMAAYQQQQQEQKARHLQAKQSKKAARRMAKAEAKQENRKWDPSRRKDRSAALASNAPRPSEVCVIM